MNKAVILSASLCLLGGCGARDIYDPDGTYAAMTRNPDGSYSCTPDQFGKDTQTDIAIMRDIAETVSINEQGYYEAEFKGGFSFVYIPAGEFEMGTNNWGDDEKPAHKVHLDGYWMGKDFITNNQFQSFVEATQFVTDAEKPEAEGCYVFVKNPDEAGGDWTPVPGRNWRNAFDDHPTEAYYRDFANLGQHPVGCVSWYDSMAFADWLSKQTGLSISLPTEAQWEKAARGTDGRAWPWGNTPPTGDQANFADASFAAAYEQPNQGEPDTSVDDGWSATSPVGSHPAGASPYGVMDMGGNTTAWVFDVQRDYSETPTKNPAGIAPEEDRTSRAMRGGFWIASRSTLTPTFMERLIKHTTRSELRAGDDPRTSDDHLGFRVTIDYCGR